MGDYSTQKPIATITVQINSGNVHKEENVTLGDVVLNAVCQSLKHFPEFNSNFDGKLMTFPYVNIGYIINLGKGPKMAVIEDADKKSIVELSKEVKDLALKYIHNELPVAEKISFSITNLSSFKVHQVIAPLNKNHSSTISIASEFDSFGYLDEKIVPAKKFNLTLSYDARISDCQKAIQFLNLIKDTLEKS